MYNSRNRCTRVLLKYGPVFTIVGFFFYSSPVYSWPWQSCDSKWESAWTQCRTCTELPHRLKPACEPEDSLLKTYPKGSEDPRYKEVLAKRAKEYEEKKTQELSLVSIEGASYNIDWGQNFSLSLHLRNRHPSSTLREAVFQCQLEINNSIELFKGYVYSMPSLLPNRRAEVDVEFQGKQKLMVGLYTLPHHQWFGKEPHISTRNQNIDSLQFLCDPINVFFW